MRKHGRRRRRRRRRRPQSDERVGIFCWGRVIEFPAHELGKVL
jgi:hypothetical protein